MALCFAACSPAVPNALFGQRVSGSGGADVTERRSALGNPRPSARRPDLREPSSDTGFEPACPAPP